MPYSPTRKLLSRCSGYTLVELMVATVILGLCLTAVLTMVSIGNTVQSEDGIRRQARMLLSNKLEQPIYQTYSKPKLLGETSTELLKSASGASLSATLTVTVQEATFNWTAGHNHVAGDDHSSTVEFPGQIISAQLVWTLAGITETYSLQKTVVE